MSRHLKIILADFLGLVRVCGLWIALRWLAAVALHFRQCRRERNLQPADRAIGDGPITVRRGGSTAILSCHQVLTGIREIWVRDEYLGHDYLQISPSATVVDLGCNMGGFSTLALAHAPAVRIIAVEADPNECARMKKTLALNGWTNRVNLINAFIGGRTEYQNSLLANNTEFPSNSISQDEIVNLAGGKIDLLKCDIEGSEYELFTPASPLLAAARQVAAELHPHAGDPQKIIDVLKTAGFEVTPIHHPPTITVLARR